MLWSTYWIVCGCCSRKKIPWRCLFLGSMTNFTSICTLVSQEHKYQTILTCTQLESVYFMRGMTFFNSTVFIGYGSHVCNKLEPYTISSITLWKNLSFRKVFRLCPCFRKNSKERTKFVLYMLVGNTWKPSEFRNYVSTHYCFSMEIRIIHLHM